MYALNLIICVCALAHHRIPKRSTRHRISKRNTETKALALLHHSLPVSPAHSHLDIASHSCLGHGGTAKGPRRQKRACHVSRRPCHFGCAATQLLSHCARARHTFSKLLSTVPLYNKCARALTFENLCLPGVEVCRQDSWGIAMVGGRGDKDVGEEGSFHVELPDDRPPYDFHIDLPHHFGSGVILFCVCMLVLV